MNRLPKGLVAAITVCALSSCNAMGPKTIRSARFNYNEAISRSWDEQLLLNLVRLHFRDTPLFLEITDITTSYSIGYSANADALFSKTRFSGLSGKRPEGVATGRDVFDAGLGVTYQERPTITYLPLQGRKFAQHLLTPIEVDAVLLFAQAGWSIERILRMFVQELGGLHNAPSASGPTPDYVPQYEEFQKLASVLRNLQKTRALELVSVASSDGKGRKIAFRFVVNSKTADDVAQVMEILGIDSEGSTKEGETLVLVYTPQDFSDRRGIRMVTRSLLGVMHYLSNAVEITPEHEAASLVTITHATNEDGSRGEDFDWKKVTGDIMEIRASGARPGIAYVKVHYRGSWFYIADDDLNSKTSFGLLSNLVSLQAMEISDSSAPVKTISVR